MSNKCRITRLRPWNAKSVDGFYVGGVYPAEALSQYGDAQMSREVVGEGPPECDEVATVAELAEKAAAVRDWIG